MKRFVFSMVFVLLLVALLTSCSSGPPPVRIYDLEAYASHTYLTKEPLVAKLNVKAAKATGRADGSGLYSLEILKDNAIYDALRKTNADVMVEPKFAVTITRGNHITVEVTGFPATYADIRSVTEADTLWIKDSDILLQPSFYRGSTVASPPPAKASKWFFGIF